MAFVDTTNLLYRHASWCSASGAPRKTENAPAPPVVAPPVVAPPVVAPPVAAPPVAAAAPQRAVVLDTARDMTCGDRNAVYGEPVANMQHIADIFNAITGRDLSGREIALVHQATKLARRAKNVTHMDSYVDGAAYAGIEYECALAEKKHKVD